MASGNSNVIYGPYVVSVTDACRVCGGCSCHQERPVARSEKDCPRCGARDATRLRCPFPVPWKVLAG